ncbi:hypothetical protein [Pseudovibrio sp. Tun.PSC04-5.I4]|uniref:hypothetical protein n=1 Tax=Pseudovibrio sp. Tun.PSC04-5.I4 TaxID=1798213 RepID=UPI000AC358CF|nr:hypothetical protein [Pseudovibrio sp. Tun.PSC04-5.I4]
MIYTGTEDVVLSTTRLRFGTGDNEFSIVNSGTTLTWTGDASPSVNTDLKKTGDGTLIFAGGTKGLADVGVDGGTFLLGGSPTDLSVLTGDVEVNSGGTLGCRGTIDGTAILNGGTFSPDASFGTTTVGGLNAGTTSTLNMEIGYDANNPGIISSDQIIVSAGGIVDLTGINLKLVEVAGPDIINTATIVDIINLGAGATLIGTFASITDDMYFLDAVVNIDTVTPVVGLSFVRNANRFGGVADTPNEGAVAGAGFFK